MTRVLWRWEERDFGFRFRAGTGRQASEYYQARVRGEFYVVPASRRKLSKHRMGNIAKLANAPPSARIVANPWQEYDRDWDRIVSEDGICLNWAGCLELEEINRREDEGVHRAMELVIDLVERVEPVALSLELLKQIHIELMGTIYPFAGSWRTVALHKGTGPTKWPFPPGGIQPPMDMLQRDVLSRSPCVTDNDQEIFDYASEVMNEILAIHPFREGNGRTAFLIGNLIMMQNDMLPLSTYERRMDEHRYYAACEAGRGSKDYEPLATLLAEWSVRSTVRWKETNG